MEKENLILWILGICVVLLLIAFVFAMFFLKNSKKDIAKKEQKISANALLSLLKNPQNSLKDLEEYVKIAEQNHREFMRENTNFDVDFLMILTTHKAVSAPLLLNAQKFFKNAMPERTTLLEKALGAGLGKR